MRASALLIAVVLAAGCSLGGGDGGAAIDADELRGLVLQPEDLPRVFVRFDEGPQGVAELPGGAQAGGSGWKARYRRPGTPATDGPLVIASLVNRYDSEGDAEERLEARRAELTGGELAWKPVEAPALGDESLALTVDEGVGSSRIRYVVLAWRDANVTASLEVNGFAAGLDVDDAVELARKQAQRIEQAAS